MREQGLEVDVLPADEVDSVDRYGGVIVGGSIYFGRWHGDAVGFLKRHRATLVGRPTAAFALGPLTLEECSVGAARAPLERRLAKVPELDPISTAIFGGVVDPSGLRFPFSRMPASDARDWAAIRAWALELA
jgi:menaquinone-dependent protoporphyrinogen oxidase